MDVDRENSDLRVHLWTYLSRWSWAVCYSVRRRWIAVVSTGFVLLIFLHSIWVGEAKDSCYVVALRWSGAIWLGPEPGKCVNLLCPWASPVYGPFLVSSLPWCSWWFEPFLSLIIVEMIISSLYSATVRHPKEIKKVQRSCG